MTSEEFCEEILLISTYEDVVSDNLFYNVHPYGFDLMIYFIHVKIRLTLRVILTKKSERTV